VGEKKGKSPDFQPSTPINSNDEGKDGGRRGEHAISRLSSLIIFLKEGPPPPAAPYSLIPAKKRRRERIRTLKEEKLSRHSPLSCYPFWRGKEGGE